MAGKVIAVIGCTRCGKSFLTKKLAEHYGAPYFLEGEEHEWPPYVVENVRKNINPIERYRYFRDVSVAHHLAAEKAAQQSPLVFIDTFWFNNAPWIDVYDATENERKILRDIFTTDGATLPRPFYTLYLRADIETSRKLAETGGRTYEKEFDIQLVTLKKFYDSFMKSGAPDFPFAEIDRSGLDFDKPEHLKIVTDKIDAALSGH